MCRPVFDICTSARATGAFTSPAAARAFAAMRSVSPPLCLAMFQHPFDCRRQGLDLGETGRARRVLPDPLAGAERIRDGRPLADHRSDRLTEFLESRLDLTSGAGPPVDPARHQQRRRRGRV